MHNLTVIVASTRPGRVGPVIARWFTDLARMHEAFDVQLADLAEIDLPFLNEVDEPSLHNYRLAHTRAWSAIVDAADAFVFILPEYNNGFTAPLKNALDYLFDEWAYKPVGFVSYGMTSAGLRAVQMIKPVVAALRMVPAASAVSVPLRQRLDSTGALQPDRRMADDATAMLDELQQLTYALGVLRTARAGAAAVAPNG